MLTTTRIASALLTPLVLLSLLRGTEARAQTLTDLLQQSLRRAARDSGLGSGLQTLSVFGATPGVSAAVFNVDHDDSGSDLRIQSAKLPLSLELAPVVGGIRPYGEVTCGYVHAREKDTYDLGAGEPSRLRADFDTYSALAGLGATIPVPSVANLRVRPILLAGYSRLDGDGKFKGPFSSELNEASSGLIRDLRVDTVLLGGALEALYDADLGDDIDLLTDIRYNAFHARNFDASDSVLETSDEFYLLTGHAELDGPTPLTLFGRETRWIGFAGATWLPDEHTDALGFDYFFQVGGGMALMDREIVTGVSGVGLRASVILGEDVDGWSAGLSLEF